MFQYHPDVCRGRDCGVQFHQINDAYDVSFSKFQLHSGFNNITIEVI